MRKEMRKEKIFALATLLDINEVTPQEEFIKLE